MTEKIRGWTEHVRTGYLTRQEAWHCLQTTVMKTIDYCLPASILAKSDIDNIMKPLLQIGLPKAGVCRTMARSVVYGSITYQGLGIHYPFWIQGIYKIYLLLDQSNVTTQKLIDVSWIKMVRETGLGPNFWEYEYNKMKSVFTKGWLSTLWEFLSYATDL